MSEAVVLITFFSPKLTSLSEKDTFGSGFFHENVTLFVRIDSKGMCSRSYVKRLLKFYVV